MTEIKSLQKRIVERREQRGFVKDPLKIHLMLTEEVGEVARELKRTWSPNYEAFDKTKLADEISDVFVFLSALANEFDIDIAEAVEAKFFDKDSKRQWKTAKGDNV